MSPHVSPNSVLCAGLLWLTLAASASAQTVIVEYVHTDALGSPVATSNASGILIERQAYEPYGAPILHGSTDGPGFTGHVEDSATGLNYMQQRYYDSSLGQFLSIDPLTALSRPDVAFGRYRYANDNPYAFNDPDGRCAMRTGSHICGGGGAAPLRVMHVGSISGAKTVAHNGRNRGEDSISKITPSGTNNATTENVKAVMDYLGIPQPPGVQVFGGDAGGQSGVTENLSGSPTVTIGDKGFSQGLNYLGNVLWHEFNHADSFINFGNIKGVQDAYMREVGAHQYNIDNPIPGTPAFQLQIRQNYIDRYKNALTPENREKVEKGIYHGN